jgi:transposase InsO family protein
MERQVKMSALCFLRWSERRGRSLWDASRDLGIAPKTLLDWQQAWKKSRLRASSRGRPVKPVPVHVRESVVGTLRRMGPTTGVSVLHGLFPDVPRRSLEEILHEYRLQYRRNEQETIEDLKWTEPGTVWAADYTEPPMPIDRGYRKILVVRDLASGKQLMALPVPQENGWATAAALESLFLEHGAPLVLKSDNGSPLKAEIVQNLLKTSRTVALWSPPQYPQFNGACEAGIGSLKTRAHHLAAWNGRPGQWTCDDVEGARLMANETARPLGLDGPTPDELWAARRPVLADEKDVLQDTVDRYVREEEQRRNEKAREVSGSVSDARTSEDSSQERDDVVRSAIRRALVKHGYLVTRRRRITSPILAQKTANIS